MSFEKTTDIYNQTANTKLNADRFETAWFVYRIIQHVKVFSIWPRKEKTKELHLEELCSMVYPEIRNQIDTKWRSHVCNEVGCKERFIVMDGNEKLSRLVCAAPRTKVFGNHGEVNHYQLCINNPIRGNQYNPNSKFCKSHVGDQIAKTIEQLDMRPVTRLFARNIPKTVVSGEGCKKSNNINNFHDRTAGMFYFFRSCGIILTHFEMYTSESLSDIFTYLVDYFGNSPNKDDLVGIVYDRSCDLHPFLERLSKEGNSVATNYANLDFVVDSFHVQMHTQDKCILKSEKCRYHPKLERYSHVRNMNSEIAEQSFGKSLNSFKCSTRKMTYSKRLLFLKFMDDSANNRL